MNYDNPAARLLAILEKGKAQPGTAKCRSVWEGLLEVQGDEALLMSRVGKVMELTQLAVEAIRDASPETGDSWSHWAIQVNAAFMVQNMHATWDTFIGNIDSHTISYLRISSSLLQARSNTKLIAGSELASVRSTLEALITEVLESSESAEVKRYLLRSIRQIVSAIDEYRLGGALPVLDAIESAVGHVVVDKEYKNFLVNTELGKRVFDTLSATANLVTVAVGLPQLTQAIALLTN